MPYDDLIKTSVWNRFSKKMAEKFSIGRNAGYFTKEDAQLREMHYACGKAGFVAEGNAVALYWLVDPTDGIVVDARFQAFGPAALIAAAEGACDLIVSKNYDQASRISSDLIDKHLRDKPDVPAFPEETFPLLNLILEAVDAAAEMCKDIPLAASYVSPLPHDIGGEGYPGWSELTRPQKLSVLEKILTEEVRPYIELDEGGIEILEFRNDKELVIAYQGSCTSCLSSIGATLSTIQQIVQAKVHPDITVVPNLDNLTF